MSPEQLTGAAIESRSDIYAFGILIYQMTTGLLPFADEGNDDKMQQRLGEPSARLLEEIKIDPGWEAVIVKCLSLDPSHRFALASEVPDFLGAS
jgi:serine/threonine protein kinase